jgi:choline dehydrogenase-like flavoprotein
LAARLSERSGRHVVLLDAGPDRPPSGWTAAQRDPDRLPRDDDGRLDPARVDVGREDGPVPFLRGRGPGGSSNVNGAYFVRPPRADLDGWAERGLDRWSQDELLPSFRRLETDHDLGASALHGAQGPMPVRRHGDALHPLTQAFFAACADAGHPEHADLNDGGSEGWGLVPRNVDARGRVDVATAYLDGARDRPNLELRSGWAVDGLVVESGRVAGVRRALDDGVEVLRAPEVVLCAGALASPELLDRSLLGQRTERRAALHPAIDLHFEPAGGVDLDTSPLVQGVLHHRLPSGSIAELLMVCRPYGRASGAWPGDGLLSLRVSLMELRTRAVRRPGSAPSSWRLGGPDRWHPSDRQDLLDAVRMASSLAASPSFSAVVAAWHGPSAAVLADDDSLERWLTPRLVVSMHAAASLPMGIHDGAAVDQTGRVLGVAGLRVVDTSILPDLPSRGPAYMAVAIAEHLAPTFD